jgi:hypothetical protein
MAKKSTFWRRRGHDAKVVGVRTGVGAAAGFGAAKAINYGFDKAQDGIVYLAGELDGKISDSVNSYVNLDAKVTEQVEKVPGGREAVGLDRWVHDNIWKPVGRAISGSESENVDPYKLNAEVVQKQPYDCNAARDFVDNHNIGNVDVTLPVMAVLAGYGAYRGLKRVVKHRLGGLTNLVKKVFDYGSEQ